MTTVITTSRGTRSPFRNKAFVVLWGATVVSNVGTWMNDVGAGRLMTDLAPSPRIVAAVQAATTLPDSLFAVLAGAIADIVDRRRLLLVVNLALSVTALLLAGCVRADAMTPELLLVFTFLLGSGAAFIAPAWQAIIPKLVPGEDLTADVALNSMGINIARAIGPAVAGLLIAAAGLVWPFALNAASTLFSLLRLSGRCCRFSPARCWTAARDFTTCCLPRSASAPSAARWSCRACANGSGPTARCSSAHWAWPWLWR